MVIRPASQSVRQRGSLMTELLIAMALLLGTLIPFAYSIHSERLYARAAYHRAVAMEIVDGEMEVLLAGGLRAFQPGTHAYPIRAGAATNLPPGQFLLTVEANKVRLEWDPTVKQHGLRVVREVMVK
jgi:hypothetical protein